MHRKDRGGGLNENVSLGSLLQSLKLWANDSSSSGGGGTGIEPQKMKKEGKKSSGSGCETGVRDATALESGGRERDACTFAARARGVSPLNLALANLCAATFFFAVGRKEREK